MSKPKTLTLNPVLNDVDYISTTETITTPWALQLDGVLTFSTPQHVTVTVTSNETGETFTVVGTDRYDNVMTETLAGPNSSVVLGTKNFKTVTSITGTADATGVTAGVNGLCESGWYVINYRGGDFNVAIGCTTGGATYAMQHTFTQVQTSGFLEDDATVYTHSTITGETTNVDGNYTNPPVATRLAITTSSTGPVTATIVHARGRA
jgi:hypothetical protein